ARLSGGEDLGGTLPAAYYADLKSEGVVDATETVQARTTQAVGYVPDVIDGDTQAETVHERLQTEFDDTVVDRVLTQLRERGLLSRTDDIYRWHGGGRLHGVGK
ncbi:MAG: hypothetical protein ACOCY1_03535, partial [Halovenus sp.]